MLGSCGNGPNVGVEEIGAVFTAVDMRKACDIFDEFYGVKITAATVEALQVRILMCAKRSFVGGIVRV